MVISMLKIRRPLGRLIFNMGIAIPGKTVFLIETAPGFPMNTSRMADIRTELAKVLVDFLSSEMVSYAMEQYIHGLSPDL